MPQKPPPRPDVAPPETRDRRLDTTGKGRMVDPQRRRQESSDDPAGVAADDAREAALRAAAAKLEQTETKLEQVETAKRAIEVRAAQAEAERDRNAAEVGRLSAVAPPPPTPSGVTAAVPPPPLDPEDAKALRVHLGRGRRIVVPLAVMTALAPLLAAGIQHLVAYQRKLDSLSAAVAGFQADVGNRDDRLSAQERELGELTNTVARLSGYLAGALGAAGVNAKAEPGATAVDVRADPLPPGTPRRPRVRVATPVPAPAPR